MSFGSDCFTSQFSRKVVHFCKMSLPQEPKDQFFSPLMKIVWSKNLFSCLIFCSSISSFVPRLGQDHYPITTPGTKNVYYWIRAKEGQLRRFGCSTVSVSASASASVSASASTTTLTLFPMKFFFLSCRSRKRRLESIKSNFNGVNFTLLKSFGNSSVKFV